MLSNRIQLMDTFPAVLPKGASRFQETQLIFVHADQAAEFAVGLLVPVPFVTDAIVDAHKGHVAEKLEKHYHSLDVFEITDETLSEYPTLSQGDDGYQLFPLMFIEECFDDVYRLSISYQLEKDDWINRYYFHLPTTIPSKDIANPSPELMRRVSKDIHQGSKLLLSIIEKDIKQQYGSNFSKATVGSLYMVGGNIAGITNPTILAYKNSQILSEDNASITVRVPGDPKAEAKAGGMAFGVHYFYKDQLHTLKYDKSS